MAKNIYLNNDPEGIDKVISIHQEKLFNKLPFTSLDAYGRCYLFEKEGKTYPSFFVKNNDYTGILSDKNEYVKFFFLDDDYTQKKGGKWETEINLFFMINLKKVLPNITHRADEEVKIIILKELSKIVRRTDIDIQKGNDVLKGFETKFKDSQPYHFLKFTYTIKYNINEC